MPKKNVRNFIGYGSKGKKISWPNNAKLALQIVLNYEEGGEKCVLNGDKYSETFLSEIIGAKAIKGRHISMESIYEYGSRAGFWRLDKLFKEKKIPVTIFGVGLALKQNPEVCEAIKNEITKSSVTILDPKTKLQEYSLKNFKKLPIYKLVSNKGPRHNPTFKVTVAIKGTDEFFGFGSSIKEAEQQAANKLLKKNNIN